jgi:leucyl aminopeptidase
VLVSIYLVISTISMLSCLVPNFIMRLPTLTLLALPACVVGIHQPGQYELDQAVLSAKFEQEARYLIELSLGRTQWVTEEEKWELRKVSI